MSAKAKADEKTDPRAEERGAWAKLWGRRLRDLREKADLNAGELAERTGIARTTIYSYEYGRRMPSMFEMTRLAEALKVSPNQLVYGSDEMEFVKSEGAAFLDVDDEATRIMRLVLAVSSIPPQEQAALSRIIASLAEANIGREKLLQLGKLADMMAEEMRPALDSMAEESAEKVVYELQQRGLDLGSF